MLGATVFPAGSKLQYQTSTATSNPDTYNPSSAIYAYSAAIVAGGRPVYDTNGVTGTACGQITAENSASLMHPVSTLDDLIASNPGKPCVYDGNDTTGPRNERWSMSTLGIGNVNGPAPTLPFYQSTQPNRTIRVGFTGGSNVAYFICARQDSSGLNGAAFNCDAIGSGTFTIEKAGDARVLRFTNLPPASVALTFNIFFVERGGQVYSGRRDKLLTNNAVRPNTEATDALLGQVGLSR